MLQLWYRGLCSQTILYYLCTHAASGLLLLHSAFAHSKPRKCVSRTQSTLAAHAAVLHCEAHHAYKPP